MVSISKNAVEILLANDSNIEAAKFKELVDKIINRNAI